MAFLLLWIALSEIAGANGPKEIDGISIMSGLKGEGLKPDREFMYWDYGNTLRRYDQAVRLGDWKRVRLGQGSPLELYNLKSDIGETKDLAKDHPDVVKRIEKIMDSSVTPSDRYPIGKLYQGGLIWNKTW